LKSLTNPLFNNALKHFYKTRSSIVFLIGFFLLLLSACSKSENKKSSDVVSVEVKKIDELLSTSKLDEATQELSKFKTTLASNDLEGRAYYYAFKSSINIDSTQIANAYADSALLTLNTKEVQKLYPQAYIRALIAKSDILIRYMQFDEALENYFRIKNIAKPEDDPVLYADYLSRISQLFYKQERFLEAARANLEIVDMLDKQDLSKINGAKLFFIKQGTINNGGYSFEQADRLDSAEIMYNKGLSYIDKESKNGLVSEDQLLPSKSVFLDNLGGVQHKQGKNQEAINTLKASILAAGINHDKISVTTYIKLADSYIALNQLAEADSCLKNADRIYKQHNLEQIYQIGPRILKAKSNWYAAKGDYKQSLFILRKANYIVDSIRNNVKESSKVNLTLKFENLQNKQTVDSLEKKNEYKNIFLVGALIFILMIIPIIVLTIKNSHQAIRARNLIAQHNEELEQKNKDYAKMMKVMAHDLKNPLAGMMGVAKLMLEDERNAEDQEMLGLIATTGENSIEMINELLNSKLATENEKLVKEEIDLCLLLTQCVELLQYRADEKKQKIEFQSCQPLMIMANREKIWRVVNNLIVNAIKFSKDGAKIKLSLKKHADHVQIAVKDNGIGVPDKDKEKIFEMFTSAKRHGTSGEQPFGLGLSICKQIIEGHNGKIWIEDNPKGGSIFTFELPT